MTRHLLTPVLAIVLLAGCRQNENDNQLRTINQSLEYSNGIIDDACRRVCMDMQEKLRDPRTSSIALTWTPKVMRIKTQADSINAVINNLKEELITQSDGLKKVNIPAVKQLAEPNGNGYTLLNKLADFRDSIPAILKDGGVIDNPRLYEDINRYISILPKTIRLLPDYTDSMPANQRALYIKEWIQNNLPESSPLMAMVMLNKIENDVLTTAYTLMNDCRKRIAYIDDSGMYVKFEAIATLSSSYVKAGQPIEIYAGVGSFSEAAKPTIIVNGKLIKLDADATATYRFTATGKPGKYTIPVKISYFKPDGSRQSVTVQRSYTIAP
jgi:hypothetical protein